MGKNLKQLRDSDILDEKYKGPDIASAAAGEGYIAHFQWLAIGLIGGGALTYVFHQPITKYLPQLRRAAVGWSEKEPGLTKLFGNTILFVFGRGEANMVEIEKDRQAIKTVLGETSELYGKVKGFTEHQKRGFGYAALDHLLGWNQSARTWLKSRSETFDNALSVGGLFGAFGFFGVPLLVAPHGALKGIQGKNQFKRAQEEVRELREDLQFLEEKNAELRQELRGKDDGIVISKDAHPKVAERPVPATNDPHELDVQAKRTDHKESPFSITPPKIEPPEPAAPPVDNKDVAPEHTHSDRHAQHKNHSDRHKSHAGKSHGDSVRNSQAEAADKSIGAA